ncbi:hypothetical protein DFP92_11496 [Yoonia sediminilitoris]|uniref:Uncharacterized protein n=1 Tax=Yoonia sediminilitoris TaxID=1286148 RepID=A0A2T6K999_9RHOB|nr:hypothetical protein C8N45_11496 [Yoonia sediminilitoris]RCW91137.1 hypothetical protein DFP92_11496 [Yoonia sediminilitoris]
MGDNVACPLIYLGQECVERIKATPPLRNSNREHLINGTTWRVWVPEYRDVVITVQGKPTEAVIHKEQTHPSVIVIDRHLLTKRAKAYFYF